MNRTTILTLALVVLTLAAALPQPATAQIPQNATDFVVTHICIGGRCQPGNVAFEPPVVGIQQNVTARVLNNGTEEARASVFFWWGGTGRALQTGTSGVSTVPELIPARERRDFNFTWFPDEGQAGNGTILAEVRPTIARETNPDNNLLSAGAFVEHRKIELTFEDVQESVTSEWVAEQDGDGHYATVAYRFRVHNRGNVRDVANVTIEGNETWYRRGTQQFFTIDPDRPIDSFVLLRPPSNATNETTPERLNISGSSEPLRVLGETRGADPNVLRPSILRTQPVYVYEAIQNATNFSVSLEAPSEVVFLKPGVAHRVTLAITNTGKVKDVFNVTPRLVGTGASRVSIVPADPDVNATAVQVFLDPNRRRELKFDVVSPLGLELAQDAVAHFDVASANARQAQKSASFPVRATGPDLTVETLVPTTAFYAGTIGVFNVAGWNRGDAPIAGVPLSLRYLREGSWVNLTQVTPTLTVPGRSPWSLQVPLNLTGLAGRYRVEARADPDEATREHSEANNTIVSEFVVRTTAFEVEAPPPQIVVPGERLRFAEGGPAFYVRNLGSHDELFELRLTTDAGLFDVTASRLVPANARLAIELELDVPMRPGVSSDVLHARVTAPAEGRTRIDAQSAITIEDRGTPTIAPMLPAEIVAGNATTIRARIVDETRIRSAFAHVTTEGNRTQVLELRQGAGDVFEASFTPSEVGPLTIRFEARDGAEPPNVATSNGTRVLVVPSGVKPEIRLQAPTGRLLGAGAIVRWDVVTDAPSVNVSYTRDDGPRIDIAPPYLLRTDDWPDGERKLTVYVQDAYGRKAEQTFTFTRDVVPPDLVGLDYEEGEGGFVALVVTGSKDATGGSVVTTKDGRSFPLEGKGPFKSTVAAAEGDHLRITLMDGAGNLASFESTVPAASGIPGAPILVVLLLVGLLAMARRRG